MRIGKVGALEWILAPIVSNLTVNHIAINFVNLNAQYELPLPFMNTTFIKSMYLRLKENN